MRAKRTATGITLRPRTAKGFVGHIVRPSKRLFNEVSEVDIFSDEAEEEKNREKRDARRKDKGKEEASFENIDSDEPSSSSSSPSPSPSPSPEDDALRLHCIIQEAMYAQEYGIYEEKDKNLEYIRQLNVRIRELSAKLDAVPPKKRFQSPEPKKYVPPPPRDHEVDRMADGTEMRFTKVASDMGIIWARVPENDKRAIYGRAAELHNFHYGCWPDKVNVWTKDGIRPVFRYTKATYEKTMQKALEEVFGEEEEK